MSVLQSQTIGNLLIQPVADVVTSDPQTVTVRYELRESTSGDSSRSPSSRTSTATSPTLVPSSARISLPKIPPTKKAFSKTPSPRRKFLSLLGDTNSCRISASADASLLTSPLPTLREIEASYLPPLRLPFSPTINRSSLHTLSAAAPSSSSSSVTAAASFLSTAATSATAASPPFAAISFSVPASPSLASFSLSSSTTVSPPFAAISLSSSSTASPPFASCATSSNAHQTAQTERITEQSPSLRPDQMADLFCTVGLSEEPNFTNCAMYTPFLDVNYKKGMKLENTNSITFYTSLEVAVLCEWKEAVSVLINRGSPLTTSSLGAPVWSYLHRCPPHKITPFFSEQEQEKLLHTMPVEAATSFDFVLYLYTTQQYRYAEICLKRAIESNSKPQWWNNPKQASEILFLAITHGHEALCEKIIKTGMVDGNYVDAKSKLSLMDLILQKRLFNLAVALTLSH